MAIFSAGYYTKLGIFLLTFIRTIIAAHKVNLTLTENDGCLTCSIHNDSTGTALVWDTEEMPCSYPSHENYLNITQNITIEEGNLWNQYSNLVFDYRWESLPLAACFYELPKQVTYNIPISVQVGNFIHICKDNNTCQKFSVGDNLTPEPHQDNGDKNRCNIEIEYRTTTWQHFTIRRRNSKYIIKQNNSTLQFNISKIEPQYIFITGNWKVHDINVHCIKSNNTVRLAIKNDFPNYDNACYGLLVKTPKNSSLDLELKTEINSYSNKTSRMVSKWHEINLCAFIIRKNVTLLIKPNISSGEFVLIADVIRHYRIGVDVRNSTLKKTNSTQCCYDLKFSNKICSDNLTNHNGVGAITYTPSAIGTKQLIVYSISNNSAKLRFQPDSKITPLEHYKVGWIEDNKASGSEICNQTSHCEIWTGQICVECNNLPWNSSCRFWVYDKGNTTEYSQVIATTGEKGPSAPKIIQHLWNDTTNALTLTLTHPDIPNGRITHFDFNTPGNKIDTYNVTEENLTYTHTIEFPKLNFSSDINISVSAHNKHGENSTNEIISTPPTTPQFLKDPAFIDVPCTIQISEVLDDTLSNMYVVLTSGEEFNQSRPLTEFEEKIFRCGNIQDRNNSRIIQNISINASANNYNETIDACSNLADGEMLQSGSNLFILLENTYKDNSRCKTYSVASITELDYNIFLFSLIIPIIGIIIFVVYKIIKSKSDRTYSYATNPSKHSDATTEFVMYEEVDESTTDNNEDEKNQTLPVRPLYEEIPEFQERVDIIDQNSIIWKKYMSATNSVSRCVKVHDLEDYVRICLKTQEFEAQYKLFDEGQSKPWSCGVKQENKQKNRYKNLAAYDHSRVILDIVNNDPSSDYINANYIDGYGVNKAYIATQGPKSNTIIDFWRMIWKENVEYIIMIANIIEAGQKKVERYWPRINESITHGDITVTFDEVVVFPVYESKLFRVSYNGKERIVEHLHFTAWPDHGMPFYPQTLAPFLKRTMAIPLGKSPVVVHCSAGIGRTGTLILCDISLRMAAKREEVDVFFYLKKLREQRINMVDNINQYKLVHLVLIHCLVAPNYRIPCTEDMDKVVHDIASYSKLSLQMKYLEDTLWQDEVMRSACRKIKEPIIDHKNRFENTVLDSYARITLTPEPLTDETSTYINAIKVDGFCAPSRFIVTQYPLSETVGDTWRLIDEYEISLMICLNKLDLEDDTCCKFYPEEKESMQPVPFLEIESVEVVHGVHYTTNTLSINNSKKQNQRTIKVLHVNEWKYNMLHPETPTTLLMTYEEMNRLENDRILVACHDATRASGLFTAVCCMIDQIRMEKVCDVCLAVRTVRHSRPEFVTEIEQFVFLYNCALEYVKQNEKYSNFQSNEINV